MLSKSIISKGWSGQEQAKTALVRLPVSGSICHCKHWAHTPFNMHCMVLKTEPEILGSLTKNSFSVVMRAA